MSEYTTEEKYAQGLSAELLKRSTSKFDPENGERPNAIYKCFEKKSIFKKQHSIGYFLLTQTHLNFYVDYPEREGNECGEQYAHVTTQLKDVTSICANYQKQHNRKLFQFGLILSFISMFIMFANMLSDLNWILYLGAFTGIFCIVAAFTFAKIIAYKIDIGSVHGGFTIMGSPHEGMSRRRTFNGNMKVVYNATPIEKNFIEFVEKINMRIATLQERGEYAFPDYLNDWESKI